MSSALLSYNEAERLIAGYASELLQTPPPMARVALAQALGRVLAQTVRADRDQPPFARSTRDGYACRAQEASTHQPLLVSGAAKAGDPPSGPLPPASVWEIMTGAPVPEGADAVMMIEHVETAAAPGAGTVRLLPPRTLSPGENIVPRGAQAREGDEQLAPGTVLHAGQIALAASCGNAELEVHARPQVAILATGDELVPVAAQPAPGQIRNSNGPMLAALVQAAGAEAHLLPIVVDTDAALDAAIAEARNTDLILITGGVSAGKFDLVEPALLRAGARFHFTGVRIQPGKPTVFGDFAPAPPFFGLPGNPVSSAVTFLLFAAPVLSALAGMRSCAPRFVLAELAEDVVGKAGLTRFLPARCTFGQADQPPSVAPVSWQGSGDLTALARSNCFVVLPDDAEHIPAGANVRILLP